MSKTIEGKISLVTGAARGIGKAIARKLAKNGSDVILLDINQEAVEASANEIATDTHKKTWAYAVDVTSTKALDELMAAVAADVGCVEILANCVGITVSKRLDDLDEGEWDRMMNVNLRSIWYLSKLFTRQLEYANKKQGHIVSVSSQASKIREYGNGVYSVSKAGINMLTQVLGVELAEKGISVTAACPGYVNTEMVQEVFQTRAPLKGRTPKEYEREPTGLVPMRRMSEPEEIADLMAYLVGGKADYITGVTITIAGGKTLI